MIYKTSLDTFSKTITVIITVVFAYLVYDLIVILKDGFEPLPALLLIMTFSFYLYNFFMRPLYYKITTDQLIIHRPLKDIVLNKKDITGVEEVESIKDLNTYRLYTAGGLFGYFGTFTNVRLGKMTWFATRRKENMVLVRTVDNQLVVLSPDDPQEFIAGFTA